VQVHFLTFRRDDGIVIPGRKITIDSPPVQGKTRTRGLGGKKEEQETEKMLAYVKFQISLAGQREKREF